MLHYVRQEAILRYAEYRKRSSGFLLLIIAPFFALVLAFRNYTYTWSKNLVWLFIIFYGYTFVVSNDEQDANRYVADLVSFSKKEINSPSDFLLLLYSDNTNFVDVAQPLLTFLVSRITDNGRILFAAFGLVFGYFYSRNIWRLLSYTDGKIKREALPFLILFIFVVAIWQINGFRFYTATHIFVYGLFFIVEKRRNKGLLFCALSVFVHFSFLLPLLILAIYLIIGNRIVLSAILYFSSFFISQVSPDFLRSYSDLLPAVFQERSDGYTSDEYLEVRKKLKAKGRWFLEGRTLIVVYMTNLVLLVIFFRYFKLLQQNKVSAGMLTFGLLFFAFANLLLEIPSVGARFQGVSLLIVVGALFIFVQQERMRLFSWLIKLPILASVILFVAVEIRIGMQTVGVMTIVGNPLIAPFVENDTSLLDLIK